MNLMRHAPIGATALLALAMPALSAPAHAQDRDPANWTGPYVGGSVGYGVRNNDADETLRFDTDGDGQLDDPAPAAFTGYCGGTVRGGGCVNDKDGVNWQLHAGYDWQFGNVVAGAVVEGGKTRIRDGVTGFAGGNNYSLERKLDWNGALRARVGYTTPRGTLFYGTGGVAYGQIKNRFVTSNGANSFTETRAKDKAWGWVAGGGIDQKIGKNASVGLLYRYTRFNADDYRVGVGPQTPPVAGDLSGTTIGREQKRFDNHNVAVTASYRF